MVIKENQETVLLKRSDQNKFTEGESKRVKTKLNKENPSKLKNSQNSIGLSPSKRPLTSSSLANRNRSSPIKQETTLLRHTPQKLSQLPSNQASLKLSSPLKTCQNPSRVNSSLQDNVHNQAGQRKLTSTLNSPSYQVPLQIKTEHDPDLCNVNSGERHSPSDTRSITAEANQANSSCHRPFDSLRPLDGVKPPPVSRRNARERNRVKQVSMGFAILRQHVPNANQKKKLSKVECLRGAVEYIKSLQSLLQENPPPLPSLPTPPPSEQYTHIQGNSQYTIPVNVVNQTHARFQKIAHVPNGFHQNSPISPFYDNRLQFRQMPGNSSCLEPQVLKVPKVDDGFHPAQTNTTSGLCYRSATTSIKSTNPMNFSSHHSSNFDEMPSNQISNVVPHPPLHPTDVSQFYRHPQKEIGDMDLIEALDWWQQNS